MSMVQAFSYNFSTVENPLSDSGNFVTMNNGVFTGGTLKTVSGNLCEAAALGTWGVSLYDGTVAAPSGVLPNDQYAEITLATWTQSPTVSEFYLFVRSSASVGNFAGWHIVNGTNDSELFIVVGGTTKASQSNTCSPAQGDVWRLSVTGNVYTLTQNGSAISTYTDSGSYLTSGLVGFGIKADTAITTTQANLFAAGANQCATPTFSPVAGSYGPTQTVTVTSATSGCTIYYTTDGTTPTESSSSISNGGTVSVASSLTLKAIASLTDNLDSAVGSATYTINGALTTPSFSPVAGTYSSTQSVTITSNGIGEAIYYTTDGSTPTSGSTLYTGPVSVSSSLTLKAIAILAGWSNSAVGSAAYVISSTSGAYSQPDCRVTKPNSATGETINGTILYDSQTSSNPAIPPTDSRVSKPVACGTYPQNSRTPGTYGPGE